MKWLCVMLALLATLGCSKKKRENGGAGTEGNTASSKTAEGAIRGFVEATIAGDLAAAKKYLPDEKTCAAFTGDQQVHCIRSLPRLLDSLPRIAEDMKGFQLGKIAPAKDVPPDAPAAVKFYEVSHATKPDDGFELFVVESGGEYRVAFPIKVKEPPPPDPPPG